MGWDESQLAAASPRFLSALRWLLFGQAYWPADAAEADQPIPPGLPPRERMERVRARQKAMDMLAERRAALNPED